MLAGRELYGMPKMMSDHDTLQKNANEVIGRLHRNKTPMLELSMVIDSECDPAELPFGSTFTFVRHVPSPDPDWPDLQQLLWIELQDFQVASCWQGRGHLELFHPLSSGLERLQPKAVTGAWYGTFSWVLPWAKVLLEEQS